VGRIPLSRIRNRILDVGRAADPMCAFGDFLNMIGFPEVWEFEKNYADFLAEAKV
jgi:hypothetical protein